MHLNANADVQKVLHAAFMRSLGTVPPITALDGCVCVSLGPRASWKEGAFTGKTLVFGQPPQSMLPALGLRKEASLPPLAGADACPPAEGDIPFTQSAGALDYTTHCLTNALSPAMRRRPFTRFDYTDEWNNLGFGRIRTDGSIWSAHGGLVPAGAVELAGMFVRDAEKDVYCGSYLTVYDTPEATVLWCARPVGPVDSVEWTVIERFISDWRADDMPCLPSLCQTPAGCRCLVAMRLDCDEAVGSARDLFACYKNEGVPFSLAVKTSLDLDANDMALLEDVRASGGTLLSHTHTHQPNWGASLEDALVDAETSRQRFAELWPSLPPADLAVSPFHTNPPYAVEAMGRAGFAGFVSGIIHNDPEYLLGRAGVAPFFDGGMVSISQQSMLHGDCFRRQNESVAVHVAAFEAQYAARGIFGYLDHPFSDRYQYDWESEGQRLKAHQALIAAIRNYKDVWFWSQQQCFDFILAVSQVRLHVSPEGEICAQAAPKRSDIVCRYKGKEYALNASSSL